MFKKPTKSQTHQQLEILMKRSILSIEQQQTLNRMDSGYNGEHHLYKLLQNELHCNPLQLFDLRLTINNSECQIDCLLFFQNECVLIEVKNFQGDYYIENNDWYTLSKKAIQNPLHQLHRTELLLKQFFTQHQIPLKIRSFVVFTHSEFQLYQAPVNLPIVFPTQLKRFIRKLQHIPCGSPNRPIIKKFKAHHLSTSSYEKLPLYDFSSLKKGVTCEACGGFMDIGENNNMKCLKCGQISPLEDSIMRNIYDFHTLFPTEKITVSLAAEWTGNLISNYRIRKILLQNCRLVKKSNQSYYILNK